MGQIISAKRWVTIANYIFCAKQVQSSNGTPKKISVTAGTEYCKHRSSAGRQIQGKASMCY